MDAYLYCLLIGEYILLFNLLAYLLACRHFYSSSCLLICKYIYYIPFIYCFFHFFLLLACCRHFYLSFSLLVCMHFYSLLLLASLQVHLSFLFPHLLFLHGSFSLFSPARLEFNSRATTSLTLQAYSGRLFQLIIAIIFSYSTFVPFYYFLSYFSFCIFEHICPNKSP